MEGSGLESLGVSPADYIQPQKYNMTRVNLMPRIDQENEYTIVQVGGDANLTSQNIENIQYTFTIDSMMDYYDLKHSFFKIKFYVLHSEGPTKYNTNIVSQNITNGLCPFNRVSLKLNGSPAQDIPYLGATELTLKHLFQSPSMDETARVFGWEMDSVGGGSTTSAYRSKLTQTTGADTVRSLSVVLYQPPLGIFSSEPGISVGTRIELAFYRSSDALMLYGDSGTNASVDSKVVLQRIEWWIPKPRPVAEMDAIVRKSLAEGLPMRHYFVHPATYRHAFDDDTTEINKAIVTLKKPPRAVIVYFKYQNSSAVTASANSEKINFGINQLINVTDAYIDLGTTRYPNIPYQIPASNVVYAFPDFTREYGALLKLNGSLAETRGPGCVIDYARYHTHYFYLVFNISDVPVGNVRDEGFPLVVNIKMSAPGAGDHFHMFTTILIDGEIEIEPRSGIVKAIGYM